MLLFKEYPSLSKWRIPSQASSESERGRDVWLCEGGVRLEGQTRVSFCVLRLRSVYCDFGEGYHKSD